MHGYSKLLSMHTVHTHNQVSTCTPTSPAPMKPMTLTHSSVACQTGMARLHLASRSRALTARGFAAACADDMQQGICHTSSLLGSELQHFFSALEFAHLPLAATWAYLDDQHLPSLVQQALCRRNSSASIAVVRIAPAIPTNSLSCY